MGRDLTSAITVILKLTPLVGLAVEMQAISRAHRMGRGAKCRKFTV